jgi:hypothetical protein
VVWCGVVWCGVVRCGVVWCGVVWCGVVWCGVVCVASLALARRATNTSAPHTHTRPPPPATANAAPHATQVMVFERSPADLATSRRGAGLGLDINGQKALRAISPGVSSCRRRRPAAVSGARTSPVPVAARSPRGPRPLRCDHNLVPCMHTPTPTHTHTHTHALHTRAARVHGQHGVSAAQQQSPAARRERGARVGWQQWVRARRRARGCERPRR